MFAIGIPVGHCGIRPIVGTFHVVRISLHIPIGNEARRECSTCIFCPDSWHLYWKLGSWDNETFLGYLELHAKLGVDLCRFLHQAVIPFLERNAVVALAILFPDNGALLQLVGLAFRPAAGKAVARSTKPVAATASGLVLPDVLAMAAHPCLALNPHAVTIGGDEVAAGFVAVNHGGRFRSS